MAWNARNLDPECAVLVVHIFVEAGDESACRGFFLVDEVTLRHIVVSTSFLGVYIHECSDRTGYRIQDSIDDRSLRADSIKEFSREIHFVLFLRDRMQ